MTGAASGTTKWTTIAQTAVNAANRPKSSRQPIEASNSSAGHVAVTAPSAPSMTIKPFRSGTLSLGNQSTRALHARGQGGGDAETDQGAAKEQHGEILRGREQRRAECRDHHQCALHPPWPISVQQHTNWNLGGGEGQEVDRRQQTEIAGTKSQLMSPEVMP